jgi:CysZ protein
MLNALFCALGDLLSPPLRKVVALSLAIATATFIILWIAVALTLGHLPTVGWRMVNWLIDLAGGVGVLMLSWLLFPAVVTMIMGLFLERVAAAVEEMHYPDRGPPRPRSTSDAVWAGVRLMMLSLVLNVLALPLYLLLPGLNILVFLGMNGYLLGRQYFESIALRRLDPYVAKQLRHRFAGRVFSGGVIIAGTFALPVINLVAPVVATAFMLHVFERLPNVPLSDAPGNRAIAG